MTKPEFDRRTELLIYQLRRDQTELNALHDAHFCDNDLTYQLTLQLEELIDGLAHLPIVSND